MKWYWWVLIVLVAFFLLSWAGFFLAGTSGTVVA